MINSSNTLIVATSNLGWSVALFMNLNLDVAINVDLVTTFEIKRGVGVRGDFVMCEIMIVKLFIFF